ncbi:uncharacterized protein ASCRUDRAFT_76032 [Ascoidea rubescens DSM 1968]|uniref:Uncharacterized protein n=1 Tax=Ascoidea rubescens DSM 1968 TaxID=1344418 RepID=A0A1D2VG92_9ASCO|nr:hypothetical protein ASCRUDRAFT_76032 [Ascoidea rubescens DSM 1968]ODV60645.1 hypothetical protein ASCRUDRAFT_76032 [Ascoidea rubescens DSM 1968]
MPFFQTCIIERVTNCVDCYNFTSKTYILSTDVNRKLGRFARSFEALITVRFRSEIIENVLAEIPSRC